MDSKRGGLPAGAWATMFKVQIQVSKRSVTLSTTTTMPSLKTFLLLIQAQAQVLTLDLVQLILMSAKEIPTHAIQLYLIARMAKMIVIIMVDLSLQMTQKKKAK